VTQGGHISTEPRINERIRVPEVRLVGPAGEQVGIVAINDALRLAQEADLDLVEVAPMARPPVAKLMDYGKFKYESALKARESRKNQAQTVIKEIKLRPKIDPHDYGTKKGHVERFLKQGDKVKVTIMFRGREQSRPELGFKLLQRLAGDIEELGFVESAPKQDGRNMIMVIGPHKRKTDAMAAAKAERASRSGAAERAAASEATLDAGSDQEAGSGQADLTPAAQGSSRRPSVTAAAEAPETGSESAVESAAVTPAPARSASGRSGTARAGTGEAGTGEAGTGESGTGESGTGESGTGQAAQSGGAQSGGAQSGGAQSGSAQSGSAQSGSAQSGSAQSGRAQSAPPRPAAPRPSAARPTPTPATARPTAPKPAAPRATPAASARPGASGNAAPKPSAPRGTTAARPTAPSGAAPKPGPARRNGDGPVPSPRPVAAEQAASGRGADQSERREGTG
jgi:translation initiation factor IF-3